jgi:rifampicin phosphotransferase
MRYSFGSSKGNLTQAGFPIPSGFHITTAAYDWFLEIHNLSARIEKIITCEHDHQTQEQASASIQNLFDAGELPYEVAQAYLQACAGLGENDMAVSVRFSAAAEDLPDASFAGQQETYLNVRGKESSVPTVPQSRSPKPLSTHQKQMKLTCYLLQKIPG